MRNTHPSFCYTSLRSGVALNPPGLSYAPGSPRGSDAKFEQKYVYPEWACREALINGIAHRDYSIHNGIEIFIFDDRMEIRSPGALLSTLTLRDLEELQGAHESRNALIAKVLRENKFMRELGEGMKRMFELMQESELEKPKLFSDATSFSVTLPHKSVFSILQEQWLLMFQQFNLTPLQKKIMVLGVNDREISPSEIYKAMNTDDRNTYDREVTALRKARLLIEIRANPSATGIARRNRIPKAQVPRFKVQIPGIENVASAKRRTINPKDTRSAQNPDCCVFVTNLPHSVTARVVETIFGACGKVARVQLPKDYSTGRLRGFGFVWFDNAEAARKAIGDLNGVDLEGRSIVVRRYLPRG